MKFNIIVARDILTDSYLQPRFINIPVEAQFEAECRSLYRAPQDVLIKYRDLELYDLGVYDDKDCEFDLKQPLLIGRFAQLVEKLLNYRPEDDDKKEVDLNA